VSKVGTITKSWNYAAPPTVYTGAGALNDVGLNIRTENFPSPNCNQGSTTYNIISWTSQAELSGFVMECIDVKSMNSFRSQT